MKMILVQSGPPRPSVGDNFDVALFNASSNTVQKTGFQCSATCVTTTSSYVQEVELPLKNCERELQFVVTRFVNKQGGVRANLCAFILFFLLAFCAFDVSAATDKTPQAVTKQERVILFVGDSLTAGYGVKKEDGFPEKAGEILKTKGKNVKIINGGISGSVSADADKRVKWFLKAKPEILVLALGANDGLKGTPPQVIKKNLALAIDVAKAGNVKVLLAGIRVFENLGADYTSAFARIFPELAREKGVKLFPFLLEGVALEKELNQSDGKHPNAKGHDVIAKAIAAELEKML